jgi:hypothetical protein
MIGVGKDVEDPIEWGLVGVVRAGVKGMQEVKCVRHLRRSEPYERLSKCEEPTNGSFRGLEETQDDVGQVGIGHSKGEGVEE